MKLKNLNIVVAMLIVIISNASYTQAQDGWNKEFSSMTHDTLCISDSAGAAQGNYFVRTKFQGNSINNSIIWSKGGFDVPFEGSLSLATRSLVFQMGMDTRFQVLLYHNDTTISSEFAISSDGPWYNQPLSSWSGALSRFDSLSIVEMYHPLTTVFVEQTIDFDAFYVKLGGQWVMFYDGGELGKVEGVVFHDKNQSGVKDEGEDGLAGWKMYLTSQTVMLNSFQHLKTLKSEILNQVQDDNGVIDSAETDTQGHYIFPQVSRGTYSLIVQDKNFWTPTTQAESIIVVSSDTMYHTVNFGQYAASASISQYLVHQGWNMLSLARLVDDPRVSVLFPTVTSAFEYIPNASYLAVDSLKAGVGYWLKFPSEQEVMLVGDTISADTSLQIQEGWNMIGSATQAVLVTDIGSNPPEMTVSSFFAYQGSYMMSDTIYPGNGYWVKTDRDGELILTAGSKAFTLNRIKIVDRGETPPAPPELNEAVSDRIPTTYMLEQNYPNPFNPATIISYQLPTDGWVTLKVYNILGEEVKTLVDENQNGGFKSVEWNPSTSSGQVLSSGVYFYRLNAGNFVETKKLLLIR